MAKACVSATIAAFCRRIGFGIGLRHRGARRSDGDDCTTRLPQRLLGGARQQKCRGQVGVDDAAPFCERQLAHRLTDHDAGIRDQRIKPSEAVEERSHGARGGCFLADVAFDEDRVARAPRKSATHSALGQIDDADAPAGRRGDDARWRGRCRSPLRSPGRRVRALWPIWLSRARPEGRGASPIPTTSRRRGACAGLPSESSAKVRIAAVTPEPQLGDDRLVEIDAGAI